MVKKVTKVRFYFSSLGEHPRASSMSFFEEKTKGKEATVKTVNANAVVQNNAVDLLAHGDATPSWLKNRKTKRRGSNCNEPFETNPLHILADAALYVLSLEHGSGASCGLKERSDLDAKEAEKVDDFHQEIYDEEQRKREKKGQGVTVEATQEKKRKQHTVTRCGDEEEGVRRKKKKYGKKANFTSLGLIPPPDMPQTLREHVAQIGGMDLKLVIMKQIWATDLNPHHDRFAIPKKQLENKFLTEEEEMIVSGLEDDGHKKKLEVAVIEPPLDNSRVCKLCLGKWNDSYILCDSWNKMVARHCETLNVGAIIQVWSFRVNGKLWLALVKVHGGEGGAGSGDGGSNSSN